MADCRKCGALTFGTICNRCKRDAAKVKALQDNGEFEDWFEQYACSDINLMDGDVEHDE